MEDLEVPIEWAGLLLTVPIGMFVWWVKTEFDKNDREHDRTWKAIIRLHKRMDFLVPDRCYPEGEVEENDV